MINPPESPPEEFRTSADQLSDVSPLFWAMLGTAVIAAFTAVLLLLAD